MIEIQGGYFVKVLGDRILVEVYVEDEVTKGGVVLPDDARRKRPYGVVVAVGKEAKFKFNVGDMVVFPMYSGIEMPKMLDTDEKNLVVMDSKSIVAKLVKNP